MSRSRLTVARMFAVARQLVVETIEYCALHGSCSERVPPNITLGAFDPLARHAALHRVRNWHRTDIRGIAQVRQLSGAKPTSLRRCHDGEF